MWPHSAGDNLRGKENLQGWVAPLPCYCRKTNPQREKSETFLAETKTFLCCTSYSHSHELLLKELSDGLNRIVQGQPITFAITLSAESRERLKKEVNSLQLVIDCLYRSEQHIPCEQVVLLILYL